MCLLDSKAKGEILRGRLRIGGRCRGKGGKILFNGHVAFSHAGGEGGIPFLCGPLRCRLLRAPRSRSVCKASASTVGTRTATPGMGGKLPAELRRSRGAGRR